MLSTFKSTIISVAHQLKIGEENLVNSRFCAGDTKQMIQQELLPVHILLNTSVTFITSIRSYEKQKKLKRNARIIRL